MEISFEELRALLGNKEEKKDSPFIGHPVLVRSNMAGVHMGVCVSHEGNTVTLKDSYRLYQWKAVEGIALSGVSQSGIENSKVDSKVALHCIYDVCEVMLCTTKAYRTMP